MSYVLSDIIEDAIRSERITGAEDYLRDRGSKPQRGFPFRGEFYKSFTGCCDHYKVRANGISNIAKNENINKADALEQYLERRESRAFLFRGKTYRSFRRCCKDYNVEPGNVERYSKRYNITRQEALEYYLLEIVPVQKSKEFLFRGKTYRSFYNCCKDYNLTSSNVDQYSKRHNITRQEALEYYLSGKIPVRNVHKIEEFPFRGKTYKSFNKCCIEYNLKTGRVNLYSKRHNITRQEALECYLSGEIYKSKEFPFRGKTYRSFYNCCIEYNLSPSNVRKYSKKHNITKQEAMECYLSGRVPGQKIEEFLFRGKIYRSFYNCCKDYNLTSSNVDQYSKRHNITRQEALEYYLSGKIPVRNVHKIEEFPFRGKTYKSFNKCCIEYNLKQYLVNRYSKRHNITRQEAIEWYLSEKIYESKEFLFRGKTYKSFYKCCIEYNLNPNSVNQYSRVHSITRQEALEYYLSGKPGKSFPFRGTMFKSFSKCCEHYGVNYSTVIDYAKRNNTTKQESIEYHIQKKNKSK